MLVYAPKILRTLPENDPSSFNVPTSVLNPPPNWSPTLKITIPDCAKTMFGGGGEGGDPGGGGDGGGGDGGGKGGGEGGVEGGLGI